MVLMLIWKTGKSQEFANNSSRSFKSQKSYVKHDKVGKRPENFVFGTLKLSIMQMYNRSQIGNPDQA